MKYWTAIIVTAMCCLAIGWLLRGVLAIWYEGNRLDDDEPYTTWQQVRDWWDDVRRRVRWRLGSRFQELAEWWHAWRNDLVKLPPGSVRVTSICVERAEQFVGTEGVPCEMFDPAGVGAGVYFRPCEAGQELQVVFDNCSPYDVALSACFMGRTHQGGQTVMPLGVRDRAVIEVKSGSQLCVSARPSQLFMASRLVVKLPKYVAKAA